MEQVEVITLWGLNIAELTTVLMVLFTFITTVANILLWVTTRQTVKLLLSQVNHQIASSYSNAQHYIIDAHRNLFFGILNNPSLRERFIEENQLEPETWDIQKLSEFLINQVLMVYVNFVNGIISQSHFEGFKMDALFLLISL